MKIIVVKDSRDDNMLVNRTINPHQHHCVDDDNNEYDSSDDEAVERVMNQRIERKRIMMKTLT